MTRLDAKMERWTPMEICGVQGYFNDMRIIRETIPEDMNFYELRDDCDGTPYQYENGILINFFGTFITKGELPIDRDGIIEEEDWSFIGNSISYDEMACSVIKFYEQHVDMNKAYDSKFVIIVSSENDNYKGINKLNYFSEHPEEGEYISTFYKNDSTELDILLKEYEGMFYILYDAQNKCRISSGVVDDEYPGFEMDDFLCEQKKQAESIEYSELKNHKKMHR